MNRREAIQTAVAACVGAALPSIPFLFEEFSKDVDVRLFIAKKEDGADHWNATVEYKVDGGPLTWADFKTVLPAVLVPGANLTITWGNGTRPEVICETTGRFKAFGVEL